jgi:hypothetical protein
MPVNVGTSGKDYLVNEPVYRRYCALTPICLAVTFVASGA